MAKQLSQIKAGNLVRDELIHKGWLVGSALLIALLAAGRLWWLPAHAPLNVNEGWNAIHALHAFGAGALYPDPTALVANNYPPLSFYLVGGLGRVVGDNIVAGRLVALVSLVATGAAVFALVARLTQRRAALFGALLFGLFSVTLLRDYLAINDPQWLGQALMAWALVLLVPRAAGRPVAGAVVLAAALTVAGGLTKHNLVALPLAATAWLWLTDRRTFAVWAVAGLAFAAGAMALLGAIWGADVFSDVLAPARSYSAGRLFAKGAPLLLAALPALVACRPLAAASREDRRLLLPLLLMAVALPVGVIQRAGSGVSVNAFYEAVFALAVAVGCACAIEPARARVAMGLAILPALCFLPVAALSSWGELTGRDAAIARARPFVERVAAARGPVACDDQSVCYWAGRDSALDFFANKQRLLKGDVPALEAVLREHRFALIEMRGDNPGWQENRLIPAIRARYATIYRNAGLELLAPRSDTAPPPPPAAP